MSTQFDVPKPNYRKELFGCRWQGNSMEWTDGLVNLTRTDSHASAPTLSDLLCDYPDNSSVSSACHCNTFLDDVPVELRKGLTNYLSSGDRKSLTITPFNYQFYRKFAVDYNHAELKNILDKVTENGNFNENVCRTVDNVPMFVVIFRSITDNHSNHVLVFDIRKNVLHPIDVKKLTRFGEGFTSCTVYVKDCPYILISGGHGKTQKTIEKYDVVEDKWSGCCSLKNARIKHRMVFVGGNVFVIGGKTCKSIEKYDVSNNNCTEVGSLPVGVHSFAATAFGDNVYIFGGKTPFGDVACVQCLNTKTGTVSRLPDLPFKCSGGQTIVVKDSIYFATNHGHMIKFEPKFDQSKLCSQQPYKRKHFTMFLNKDRLCIFGGLRTDGPLEKEQSSNSPNSMYFYSPDNDTWTYERSYKETVPVYTSCMVRYPKECPVKPFMKLFGYC